MAELSLDSGGGSGLSCASVFISMESSSPWGSALAADTSSQAAAKAARDGLCHIGQALKLSQYDVDR